MEKLLLSLNNLFNRLLSFLPATMLLVILLSFSYHGKAQVYLSMNDANVNVTAEDSFYKMNYDGTNKTALAAGVVNLQISFAIDGNNNRLFAYEAKPGSLAIKIINLTTGTLINTIPVTNEIRDMEYDPRTNYLYYITEGGDGAVLSAGDAINRIKGDGTGQETFVSSLCLNPYRLELDMTNNRLIVFQSNFVQRRMYTVDIPTKAVTFRAFAASLNTVWDIAYDDVNDYIYYTAENGNGGAVSASDQLRRQKSDGTDDVTLISSLLNSPYRLAFDGGNNRMFVSDSYYAAAKVVSVNLTNNTYATVATLNQNVNGPVLVQMAVPRKASLTSSAASSISSTTATLGGNLVYGYGLNTERGVVYSSTNTTPTVTDTKVSTATSTTNGAYTSSITGLSVSTTYYARAYAINSAGTVYGAVTTFSTLSNDANLSAFTISSGTLSPAFNAGTTTYTTAVANNVTGITVTPTRNQANASIKVNGTGVNSGAASGNISLNVGSNTITVIVTAQDNSTKTYTLTVTRAKTPQTITFNTLSTKTYGNTDFAPGATASSGLTLSYSSDNTGVATILNNQIHIVGQGTATITASQAGDATYLDATNITQTLTVNKAAIIVTAAAKTKVYGDTDPALTYTITAGALVGSDTFTGSLNRDVGIIVGNYPITIGTLGLNANYQLTFVSNSLTITKRPLTLAPIAATKVYGNADPGFPYAQNGTSYATTDAMTGIFSRPVGENVGTYALGIGTKRPVSLTTFEDMSTNYDITFISTNLTITKRPLIFHPVPATKVYGNADPAYPYMLDGTSVAPGEGITGTFGRIAGEDVGAYALTLGTKRPVNATTGVVTETNYDISFVSDNLTITKRSVNVYAQSQTKTYGDTDPTLTTFIQGSLRAGDALTGSMVRNPGESVGTYAITQGTLALNSNYSYTFTGENLTINKKPINVTAQAKNKTYGNADPTLTYTATTLPFGENFSGSITRATGENFGTYPITQGTLALTNNYTINFTNADFNIDKKIINVTANAKSKTYGDTDPTFNYLADALIGSDTFTGSLSRAAGENVGNHTIEQGTLALSNNYTLNYASANLSINKATLTYVSTPVSRFLKTANPIFTGNVTGFVNGETIATATTGSLLFSTTALLNSPIGNYAITGSGLSANNYDFVQAAANNTALSIVASSDNTLAALSSSLAFTPTFSSSVLNYNVNVANDVTAVDFSATINNSFASATLNGNAYSSGSDITLPLAAGGNQFDFVVTAQDETTKTYSINIQRAYSTNNLLASLVIPGVTFTPAFDPAITTYHATVPNTTENVDLYGIAEDHTAIVSGNNGLPNTALNPLSHSVSVGEFSYNLPVTAQSGARKDYTIIINRLQSSDATLASFGSTTSLTLNTPVVPGTLNYTATVSHEIEQLYFIPTSTSSRASISVNGNPVNTYAGNILQIGFGDNILNVVVTSEDGNYTNTYTLAITRTKSADATLGSLTFPYLINLNEQFDPNVYNYTANLADSTITGLTFRAISANPYATLKVNGTLVTRFDNYSMALQGGPNTFKIVVTSQDLSDTKTYTLVLTRAGQAPPLLSPNASLYSMSISSGSFSKNFNFAYEQLTPVTVANATSSINMFLYAQHAGATAKVNSTTIPGSNQEYYLSGINLAVGSNLLNIVVLAEDGVATKTYPLEVIRLPYVNVDLASLVINNGTYTPSFSPEITSYNLTVRNSVTQLIITPVAAVNTATIGITGVLDVTPQNPTATINLNSAGPPQMIRMTVRAADGVTTKRYTLNVTRLAPSAKLANLVLSSGTISPVFSPDNENLTAAVAYNVSTIALTPTAEDTNSVIKINESIVTSGNASSPITLNSSSTVINVQVTSASGTIKTYNLTIQKPLPSNNAALNNFTLSPAATLLFLASGPASVNYETSVSALTTAVTLSSRAIDANATIRVNGVIVASGVASSPINLNPGTTLINVLVTAEDGITTKTYSINVSKQGSSITTLINVSLSPNAQLKLATSGPASLNYTTSVAQSINTIQLTPTATDPNSTIRVNGTIVTSGIASAPIPLSSGITIINILVTAENGISTRTYSISITKDGATNANLNNLTLNPYSLLILAANGPAAINYSASVSASTSSITLAATAVDPNAKIRINGTLVTNGLASAPINLTTASTVINVLVTAEDGVSTKTYSVTVNKTGSSNALLNLLKLSPATPLTLATNGPALINYTASVTSNVSTVTLTPRAIDPTAVVRINGAIVASEATSSPISIGAGNTVINVLVTAEDGTTTKTYSITVTKQGNTTNQSATNDLTLTEIKPVTRIPQEVLVHAALSPNGDGVNDVLKIDGIEAYPENKLTILNRAGVIIFNTNGYNNSTKVFDGHASNGTMQLPGTYFYTFEYRDGQQTKRKTGYIIIKY